MNSSRLAFSAAALLAGTSLFAAERSADGLPLAEATVVYEDALPTDKVKRLWGDPAVAWLTNVLTKVTGRAVPAIPESQAPAGLKNAIYLGDTRAARAAGVDSSKLLNAEFRLKVAGDRAYLVGRTGMAASYAMTEFVLRFTDYRFLTMDGAGDPYTVDPAAKATALDVVRRPRIYDLDLYYRCSRYADFAALRGVWCRLIRAVSRSDELDASWRVSHQVRHCHSQFDYCPPETYFKDHPEYYSLGADGLRHGVPNRNSQLCFTNPDVYRIVYGTLERIVAKDRAERPTDYPCIYDFTQMDSCGRMCQCPDCLALVRKYDRKGGYRDGGDAGLQLQFVNRLARQIREKYPDVRIRTFAYVSTEEVPRDIVPEDNVIIWLCDLYSRCDHTRPLTHPFNADRRRIFEDWHKLTRNIQVWDYSLYGGPWEGDYPEVFPDATAADIRFFKSLGVDSVFFEHEYDGQPFWELNVYVMANLAFGPDRDVDELVDEWCRVYGRAAKPMRKAIDFLRTVIAEQAPSDANAWHNRVLPWRTAANWEAFFALVRSAYDLADTAPGRQRVAAVLASTCKNLAKLYKARPDKTARAAEVKRDYLRFAREALERYPIKKNDYRRDLQAAENFMGLLDLEFRDLPEALKGVARDRLTFYDHRQITYLPKSQATRVADASSEAGTALKLAAPVGDRTKGFVRRLDGLAFKPVVGQVKVPDDGRYHWYRLSEVILPRMCNLYFAGITFPLKDAYVESDGLDVNPNRCELWLSVKLDGDEKSPSDAKGLFVDRLILRRF